MPLVEIQPGGEMNPGPMLLPVGSEGVRPGTEILEGQYQGGRYAPHLGNMLMKYRDYQGEGGWPHLGRVRNEANTFTCPTEGDPCIPLQPPPPVASWVLWSQPHGREGEWLL